MNKFEICVVIILSGILTTLTGIFVMTTVSALETKETNRLQKCIYSNIPTGTTDNPELEWYRCVKS